MMHILYVCVPSTSSERPRWCSTMVLGRVGWEYGGDSPAHARCTELRALGVWWCIQLSANCSTQCTVQHRVAEVAGTMARNWLESLPALRSRPGLYDLIRRGEGARERDEQKCNGGYGSMSGYSLPPFFPFLHFSSLTSPRSPFMLFTTLPPTDPLRKRVTCARNYATGFNCPI